MQDPQAEKLAICFSKVFPKMERSDIFTAEQQNVAAWDSIAHVTLISLIGEEFGADLDFEEFDGATSFTSILQVIREKTASV